MTIFAVAATRRCAQMTVETSIYVKCRWNFVYILHVLYKRKWMICLVRHRTILIIFALWRVRHRCDADFGVVAKLGPRNDHIRGLCFLLKCGGLGIYTYSWFEPHVCILSFDSAHSIVLSHLVAQRVEHVNECCTSNRYRSAYSQKKHNGTFSELYYCYY